MLFARSRPRASRSWSREGTDPELLREYDAFGPWIGEVRGEADMPRRFRPHWARLAGARFLLKLPAPIDRPAAQPGQDLYRALYLDGAGDLGRRAAGQPVLRLCALPGLPGDTRWVRRWYIPPQQ